MSILELFLLDGTFFTLKFVLCQNFIKKNLPDTGAILFYSLCGAWCEDVIEFQRFTAAAALRLRGGVTIYNFTKPLEEAVKKCGGFRIWLLLAASLLNGCSFVIGSATHDFGERLQHTILSQNDPQTVADAMPAYLLTLEALLAGDSENEGLALATVNLYSAYVSLLPEEDVTRKSRLSRKAVEFASQAACQQDERFCGLWQKNPADLQAVLETGNEKHIAVFYSLAAAWANWIQANKGDWNAIAQLVQVKLLMQKVLSIDETYKRGNPQLYLAVMESLIPPNLGGKPELARQYFERAMQLAPENLMVPVLYAKHYARMLFDRDLHDSLLRTALKAPVSATDLTLINTLAQQQAQQLLDSANDYF